MTTDTVFKQTLTFPSSGSDAGNWTLGLGASLYVPGSITAIWFYPPPSSAGDYGWRIYEGHPLQAGGLLESGTITDGSYSNVGGWQRFGITPVDVTGINFTVALYTSAFGGDNYVYHPRDTSDPFDDGIIVTQAGGCFKVAADAKPDQTSTLYYGVDFEVTLVDGSTFNASQFFPFFN